MKTHKDLDDWKDSGAFVTFIYNILEIVETEKANKNKKLHYFYITL